MRQGVYWGLLLAILAGSLLGCGRPNTEPVRSTGGVPPHRIPKK